MSLIYASAADYVAWTGTAAPSNIAQLLRSASIRVTDATFSAFYDQTAGMPTDAKILQAFNDATCAQAAAMNTISVDPLAGGVIQTSVEQWTRIGTAQIRFADGEVAAESKREALTGLAPEARLILEEAGIRLNTVWVTG